MRVRVHGVKAEQDVFEVGKTCNYDKWAPREVLCTRNYMEVKPWLAWATHIPSHSSLQMS